MRDSTEFGIILFVLIIAMMVAQVVTTFMCPPTGPTYTLDVYDGNGPRHNLAWQD